MVIKRSSIEAMRFAGASLFEGGGGGIMSSQALSQELSERQQAILDKRLDQIKGKGSGAFIPVGLGQRPRVREIEPVPSVFEILQRTTRVPSAGVGTSTAQIQDILYTKGRPLGLPGRRPIKGPAVNVGIPTIRPPVSIRPGTNVPGRIQPNQIVEGTKVANDLGQLITGLGTAYINAKYPAQQQNADWSYSLPEWVQSFQTGGAEVAQVAPGCPIIPKGYFINDKGEVRKKPKRRRRRLATPSDIKDLAALSSVTNAPQKNTWIATHPS